MSCPSGSDPFIHWTYDAVGNRLTEERATGTTSYVYNAADQMTQAGSTTYAYDDDGNETQSGSRSFSWNIAGQLTSTTAGSTTTNFSYDGDGNRLQAASSLVTTNYLWDSNAVLPRLALERNGAGSPLRSYIYGLDPLSMLAGSQDYYFHGDARGSITNLTSASGQAEWTYSYEPFGKALTETKNDPMAPDNTIRFAGELLDSDSALYDLRARMYDTAAGRFLSLDPKAAPAGRPYASPYVYADDRPTVLVDPSGEGSVWDNTCATLRCWLSDPKRILDTIRVPAALTVCAEGFAKGSRVGGMYGGAFGCAAGATAFDMAEQFAERKIEEEFGWWP